MRSWPIFFFELVLSAAIVAAGVSGKGILFIHGEKSAVITLGVAGMLLCTLSVGKFIAAAPANPWSILGYVLGTAAMVIFLGQIFRWSLPLITSPRIALYGLAACLLAMGLIARIAAPVIQK